jgi:8-oxo-dGTP pyrophosphatase MutT (NUDIX family)
VRIHDLAENLIAALGEPLPGADAQKLLAPRPRKGWEPGTIPDGCRHASGLLLLCPLGDQAGLILTVRHGDLPQHAGQVSLPGGAVEEGESIEQGALREAHEEVGVDPRAVRVLGQLSPLHIPVSRFVLHPVVGIARRRPVLLPQAGEVDRILETPLSLLTDHKSYAIERRVFRGTRYEVPYVEVQGEKVWGATAMILAEFLVLLGYPPDPWGPNASPA